MVLFFSGENLARVVKMTAPQVKMSQTLMMRLPRGRRLSGL